MTVRHYSIVILIVLKKEEKRQLLHQVEKIHQIFDNDAEKASVKDRSVDWPDAGVYNV